MMNFIHNSWDLKYRDPFGALPIGSLVTLRIYGQNLSSVQLRTLFNENEIFYSMSPSTSLYMWEVTFKIPDSTGILWYDFKFETGDDTFTYGTKGNRIGGDGQIYKDIPPSYQITIYESKRTTPEWYKQGIMYQIFPDRFNRGSDFNLDCFPKTTILHPQWSDSPHYYKNNTDNIEYWDFFGGTLAGITEKLDYLKSLNVSIIYLNPIFKSKSNHRYDTGDYMSIEPILGNMENFETLMEECKKRNIFVILDGVFSHTGDDSIYFNRYGHYPGLGAYQSTESPYYDWYSFTHFPNDYTCWWGIDAMPDTNELNPDFQSFIFKNHDSVIRHWMRAGVSGWRLDVADELPDPFIEGLKTVMLEENSGSVLIGEVWEDASRKVAYNQLRTYFSGFELDAVMNYPFRETFISFVMGTISARIATLTMMSLYENYPREQFMGNMNLIGSHDRCRVLTILGEADEHSNHERYRLNKDQYHLAQKRLKLLSLLQMTFPGVPCIYYGDEAGVQGFEDPYNRGTYPWGKEDEELIGWYKIITEIRANNTVFQDGSWKPYESSDDLFVFERRNEDTCCLCLFNRSLKAVHLFQHQTFSECEGISLLTGKPTPMNPVVIEPLSYQIISINL
ncbi:glycoside hydrolase family 13 protein [Acetobacterium tundrae]|nr:glycoside hydrolase family 13 protein [Acetobacterium tundrae]